MLCLTLNGDSSGTRTRIGRFRDVRITNHALESHCIYMVLTLGFEPSLADPQSAVLTNNTKLGKVYLQIQAEDRDDDHRANLFLCMDNMVFHTTAVRFLDEHQSNQCCLV